MSTIRFTPDQTKAIETTGKSIVVTAAAGSGKTAVLSARCAHLICDLPSDQRCDIDDLLIVTFTEAAAAEMRDRIAQVIRKRLEQSPRDTRLHEQLAGVQTAHISTIHSFCRWVIMRWFSLSNMDPGSTLLDGEQTTLLKQEVLQELFQQYYEEDSEAARQFQDLVTVYGLGQDHMISTQVLRLANFLDSLPDPEEWIEQATDISHHWEQWMESIISLFRDEWRECRRIFRRIQSDWPAGEYWLTIIQNHMDKFQDWANGLKNDHFDEVAMDVEETALPSSGGPTSSGNKEPIVKEQIKLTREAYNELKNRYKKKIQPLLIGHTKEQLLSELETIQPYAETFINLVREFRTRFSMAKRAMSAIDFNDLERFAYDLLRNNQQVTQTLRNRFAHVLVDEFQDVSPLQDAILRQVSRESEPERPNNLFAVGDIKQSIYRFRLADPTILSTRESTLKDREQDGISIQLQHNFRSRKTVIAGINALFDKLMTIEAGGIDYTLHRLHPGRVDDDANSAPPVEIHFLQERLAAQTDSPDTETSQSGDSSSAPEASSQDSQPIDMSDPHMRKVSEREAHLIGTRIQELMSESRNTDKNNPLHYRDIVILLRATRYKADPMMNVLRGMGIPCFSRSRGSLLETMEAGDALSMLSLLDNFQQDIPLASVLRSGMLGDFTEDDLTQIRLDFPKVPFHQCVRDYAESGPDDTLKTRLTDFLSKLRRLRQAMRQRPLPEALWIMYMETRLLSRVSALPDGNQRRANLITLHERARLFNDYDNQGLHRFILFLEEMENQDNQLDSAAATGESEDAVQIMTIHNSKGLEYPVVFVADLGRTFNTQDIRGRILFEKNTGLGLKGIDTAKMIEYPTIAHRLASQEMLVALKDEELRVLYVALTRARDHLILIASGSLTTIEQTRQSWQGHQGPLTPTALHGTSTPLNWITAATASLPPEQVAWNTQPESGKPIIHVRYWDEEQISQWDIAHTTLQHSTPFLDHAAGLEPLPASEPLGQSTNDVTRILDRLDSPCPSDVASSIQAVMAASGVKHSLDYLTDPDERTRTHETQITHFDIPSIESDKPISPTRKGTATHSFLQHIQLSQTGSIQSIREECTRLTHDGILSTPEAESIDLDSIAWFFTDTELGKRIRNNPDQLDREVMFLSTEQAHIIDPTVRGAEIDSPVIIRGVVDGLLKTDQGLVVFDYKTDNISISGIEARKEIYRSQVHLYASAVTRSYRLPVIGCYLVFLHPRHVEEIQLAD